MKNLCSPRAIGLIAVFVLIALASGLIGSASAKGGPKMFVKSKNVDLGDFFEGTDIKYTFVIRNNGTDELQILNVRPG